MNTASLREALELCLSKGLTFAAYRWNDEVQLRVCRRPHLRIIPWWQLDQEKDLFIVSPFMVEPMGCAAFEADTKWDPSKGLRQLEKAKGSSVAPPPPIFHLSKNDHQEAVLKIKDQIGTGELEKVVLARSKELELDRKKVPDLFINALKEQPEAFVCLMNCTEYGCWMGASPEMLLQAEGSKVRVDSIAGTLPLAAAPENAEKWGSKEREEQLFVTRHVIEKFEAMELKDVQVSGPVVLRAAQVAHLHSKLEVDLKDRSLALLARHLHPTPAVCGTPNDEASIAIVEHEPELRTLYAGFWGPWRSNGETSLYVNIRCMRLLKRSAVLYIGGGITADSDPEKEWAETEHKALTWEHPIEALQAGIS